LLFVVIDPGIQVCFVETPALVQSNSAEPIANHFLFEAVAGRAAVFGGFVEIEDAFFRRARPERIPQVVSHNPGESGQINEIGSTRLHGPIPLQFPDFSSGMLEFGSMSVLPAENGPVWVSLAALNAAPVGPSERNSVLFIPF
jgi:hypothetical protein